MSKKKSCMKLGQRETSLVATKTRLRDQVNLLARCPGVIQPSTPPAPAPAPSHHHRLATPGIPNNFGLFSLFFANYRQAVFK